MTETIESVLKPGNRALRSSPIRILPAGRTDCRSLQAVTTSTDAASDSIANDNSHAERPGREGAAGAGRCLN